MFYVLCSKICQKKKKKDVYRYEITFKKSHSGHIAILASVYVYNTLGE